MDNNHIRNPSKIYKKNIMRAIQLTIYQQGKELKYPLYDHHEYLLSMLLSLIDQL